MDTGITIIGAGVIGLSIAEKLSYKYKNIYVVEKHNTFGQETSSRNSEVIHAGLYYPEGSLKAKLCVEGNRMLYEFCQKHEIPFRNCGKLIVATTPEEVYVIKGIKENSSKNGISLELIDRDRISGLEPNIFALAALYSPTTGIVDTHSLMKRLESNFIINGGQIAYGSEVISIQKIAGVYEITLKGPDEKLFTFTSEIIINSAGLTSDLISEMAGMKDKSLDINFCKGEYFKVNPPKNRLISRLVYPVPHENLEGIGIHVTVDMSGGVKLGPDVTWLKKGDYNYHVDESKREAFWKSAKTFLPFLEIDDISPDMAGIRPKIQKRGETVRDFYISEESRRGNPGFINLIGMESPGMTSCLAIAKHVDSLVKDFIKN
jgi:L-2-hydroxyglutarate oxidase LhgO